MPNFTGTTPSIDSLISASATYGSFFANGTLRLSANTIFTSVTTGLASFRRYPIMSSVPNYNSPVLGYLLTSAFANNAVSGSTIIVCLDYLLGTIDCATNTFTQGITMPTKTIRGTSIQTASNLIWACPSSAITGTNLTVNFTYTNEDGITNRSGSFTPSTSSITNTTAIDLSKSLQVNDFGVRSIQNISETGGSSGTLEFYGTLPLAYICGNNTNQVNSTALNFLNSPLPPYLIETNEKISIYSLTASASLLSIFYFLTFCPEV